MISFDNSPLLYWIVGVFIFVSTTLVSFTPSLPFQRFKRDAFTWIAFLLQILILIYLRLPAIVFNEALNPDEDVFLVGAMTLSQSPIYWEAVDGCTSGPFNFFTLTFFCEIFEQSYDYISARIVGIILMVGSFIFSFLALRIITSAPVALISIFPSITFLGLTKHWDFINFSSEQLPIFFISVMLFIFVSIYNNKNKVKTSTIFILGLISGSVIFTKLQAIPIVFGITLAGYWLLYKRRQHDFFKNAIILSIGNAFVPMILVIIGYYYNFLDKIWVFYFKNNLAYGKMDASLMSSIYISLSDPINIFIRILLLISSILSFYYIIFKRQIKPNTLGILIVFFVLSSVFAVYKTGLIFHHYLLFLVFPCIFLFAILLNEVSKFSQNYATIVLGLLAVILAVNSTSALPLSNSFVSSDKNQRPLSISETGRYILKYSHSNEPLVIWGGAGRLYLETKRTQGIRWSNSHWGLYNDSLQKNFRKEFIKELKEKPYPVFIDAHLTKNTFMTRDKLGYETNKDLKEYIDSNYQLIGEFNEQRVFVHNERLKEMKATK